MDDLIRNEFCARHCDEDGVQKGVVNFIFFSQHMYALYPEHQKKLRPAIKSFVLERSHHYCDKFPKDEQGNFLDSGAAFEHLKAMRPDLDPNGITKLWERIRNRNTRAAATTKAGKQISSPLSKVATSQTRFSLPPLTGNEYAEAPESYSKPRVLPHGDDILASKLRQLAEHTENNENNTQMNMRGSASRPVPNFSITRELLKAQSRGKAILASSDAAKQQIHQATIVAADIVAEHYKDLVPQYGLLGTLDEGSEESTDPQLFLNTNVPFSAFVCGVQGGGKSHTTSCILENSALISSYLGYLESPASTLVFSHGQWSSGGTGFNISEATFLGASHPNFPNTHVEKVTVLYSPSNPAIKAMYERLPNVQMVPFRLKSKSLDIGALHTLMAVDEKTTMPLYMATVEAILRDIAAKSTDGSMNYVEFKQRLGKEKFDATQSNMLSMRLNLLESFLDLNGASPVPSFVPGEITIMDLSDPFLTPGTACILFKLGLDHFLQSSAPGKLVVLDEAHKYMINTSGSKIFTDALVRLIRLQRHQGARVIVSTQEPTIATDLIALCSVTIMHRFTSPAWYAALRKHINAVENDEDIMQRIETLETGEALIYCPSAVLGKNKDGGLIKASRQLMRVRIRNRVTLDGGASIMAV